jgi:hypothetical protein
MIFQHPKIKIKNGNSIAQVIQVEKTLKKLEVKITAPG